MHKPKTFFSLSSNRKHKHITSERKHEHIKPSKHYSQQTTDRKYYSYTNIHTQMGVRSFKRDSALSIICDPKRPGINV